MKPKITDRAVATAAFMVLNELMQELESANVLSRDRMRKAISDAAKTCDRFAQASGAGEYKGAAWLIRSELLERAFPPPH